MLLPSTAVYAQVAAALDGTFSAAAAARGGSMAAESGDPLDAVVGNPAGLAEVDGRVLDLGAATITASGSFRNSVDANGHLTGVGALPYGAVAVPIGAGPWRASLAVTPEMLMRANWRYIDPPGTAGASYGLQSNESEMIALRTSAGIARRLGLHWDGGATLGLIYNRNVLNAPYIFQQQPQLAGLKVLLNLRTAGFGWDGSAGLQWHPSSQFRLGAAWMSATDIQSHGIASGTASAQFAALGISANPLYSYRAEVDNHLPWTLALADSWQATRRLRWEMEGDWTAWGNAFHQLPVRLTEGTNAVINSVAGSNAIEDHVPLDWRDQATLRTGIETPLGERWSAAAGYSWSSDPVPSSTLTPLTAAIFRNTIGTGAGWTHGRWRADLAWQVQLPASQSVGHSSLLAGEFDDSHVSAMTQSLSLTLRTHF
jgi:long-subunit fatty acid transport protein